MKKLLIIPILALLLASCNNNNADRAMNLKNDKQMAIDSMKMVMDQQLVKLEKQKSIDSMKLAMAPVKTKRSTAPAIQYYRTHANPLADASAEPVAAPAKKKWSNLAKGALIGAGAGAIGGAIINKKKPGKGALIGGLIGAAAGAGTGAILDAKKKKQQQSLAYNY